MKWIKLFTRLHTHSWKPPACDLSSHDAIEFTLVGEVCDCGARRIYRGPMFGWEDVEPSLIESLKI